MFSLWNTSLDKIESFVEKANNFHSTIQFTAEMSETEVMFLDTKVYKGFRFDKESILDVQTHYKPAETFQYTNTVMLKRRPCRLCGLCRLSVIFLLVP